MKDTLQYSLRGAVVTLFRPLCKVLIRNGIAWGTFAEWVKKVYVDVAYEEFGEPGKKQTISRVSALTGLFRREAKRLRELANDGTDRPADRYNRAVRVISGWVNDPHFQDTSGNPAALPPDDGQASFSALVKKYSGDIPTQAMLSVLKTAGSVTETPAGDIQLIKHAYIPGNDPVDKIHILGTDVAELIATIDHNLTAQPGDLFFQRKVSNGAIDRAALAEFHDLAAEKAQALLEELDLWLARHEVDNPKAGEGAYVSLGIFYSEHRGSEENAS